MAGKCNGWTNYATWRVHLEMFDGQPVEWLDDNSDPHDVGQQLRDMAMDYIAEEASGLALDYAEAFLAEVNWFEIAEHVIEECK